MKRKPLEFKKKNKKGQMNIMPLIIFGVVLFVVLFIGFMMATGTAILNWVFDIGVPAISNLGTHSGVNLTEAVDLTFVPLNNLIQQFTWLTGVLYVMMLGGVMGMAVMFRGSPDKWLIGFFLALIFVVVLGSMFMSNIYENFYDSGSELGTRLQEQVILSFMILYSPLIFSIIAFISGIILFSGQQEGGA